MQQLREHLGEIDIYLLDQVLRGRVTPTSRILDAGCGAGRNLEYFLNEQLAVSACDHDPEAIERARELARRVQGRASEEDRSFRVEPVEALSFDDTAFDLVISNAVLHFARDPEHFDRMLDAMWRVLAPNGYLFVRLASSIGLEDAIVPLSRGRALLPDGSERFLVSLEDLLGATKRLDAELVDPIKTTNVQGLRCMTTWVLRKPADSH